MLKETLNFLRNLNPSGAFKNMLQKASPSASSRSTAASRATIDVTANVQLIGNPPYYTQRYPRNIWDMQLFNNRIYLGQGNSSNSGPTPDAGPVPVFYLDLNTNKFVKQYTVEEEQLDIYKVIDNTLYIPGNDPREDWAFGNFYRLENDQWVKYRTIPNAIHTYDMALFENRLYAALGGTSGLLQVSDDMGNTWKLVTPTDGNSFSEEGRIFTLFKFKGYLYAMTRLFTNPIVTNRILQIKGNEVRALDVQPIKLMPGVPNNTSFKLVRANVFNNQLLYIAGSIYNDHQWRPVALYVSPEFQQAKRITFPETAALPMDILVRDLVYVLTHVKISSSLYVNIVYKTYDLLQWTEIFRFNYNTYARSFEEVNGNFYFGMGCDTDVLPATVGNILKVSRTAYQPATPT